MTDLAFSISRALAYLRQQGEEIPLDIQLKARQFGAMKAEGDLAAVNKAYNDSILRAMIAFFEGGTIAKSRNDFKRAMIQAFGDAFDLGFTEHGGILPIPDEDIGWLEARLNQEAGYIDMLFQEARQLHKEEDFDFFSWATMHAGNYVNTLREIYNVGSLSAQKDRAVTFLGDDGAESCKDCQKLKGKRHKISWFVGRGFVPPHGRGLECHPGRRCMHYLQDDDGKRVTI
jgi:hypothetical protein